MIFNHHLVFHRDYNKEKLKFILVESEEIIVPFLLIIFQLKCRESLVIIIHFINPVIKMSLKIDYLKFNYHKFINCKLNLMVYYNSNDKLAYE